MHKAAVQYWQDWERYEMGRLKELRKYVDGELNRMDDANKRNSAIVHLYGVSLAATMVAKKEGLIRKSLAFVIFSAESEIIY